MSVPEQISTLAHGQHGCVTRRQLTEAGLGRGRIRVLVRAGVLSEKARGVFTLVGAPPTWHQRVMTAVLLDGPQALAAFRTAAALMTLGPSRRGIIEVLSPRGARLRSGRRRRHETVDLPGRDRVLVDGIPTTSATRTLIDMGRYVGERRLGSMVDDAVRRGLTSYEALHERFRELARRGRPGIATMRRVLEDRPCGAPVPGSDFETMVRTLILDAGLLAPVLQHPVGCDEYRFLLDLAWPDQLVAVECEGFAYHATPDQLAWDEFRRNQLTLRGWLVLSYTWVRVRDEPDAVIAEIRRALRRPTT